MKIYKSNWMIYILTLFILLSIVSDLINHFVSNFLIWILITLPLMLLLFISGIALLILSVVHIFKGHKKTGVKSFFPIILSIALLLLVIDRPLSPIFQNAEFSFKQEKREDVARQIINGEIKPSNERGDLFLVPESIINHHYPMEEK